MARRIGVDVERVVAAVAQETGAQVERTPVLDAQFVHGRHTSGRGQVEVQLLGHVVLGERAGIGAVETVLDDVVPITEAVLGREELLGRQEDLLDEFVEASPSEDEST